jgi:hypothetical protein
MEEPTPEGASPGLPPADAEEWTDEEWLVWLTETDATAVQGPSAALPMPGRLVRSTGGQVLGNAMLGVANALYGRRQPRVVVVQEASGRPEDEDLELHLDPDHPELSVVKVHHPHPGPGAPAPTERPGS